MRTGHLRSPRPLRDLVEEVADHRVRGGGDTDRLAGGDQVNDGVGAGERLAGSRRALDREVRAPQPEDDPPGRVARPLPVVPEG